MNFKWTRLMKSGTDSSKSPNTGGKKTNRPGVAEEIHQELEEIRERIQSISEITKELEQAAAGIERANKDTPCLSDIDNNDPIKIIHEEVKRTEIATKSEHGNDSKRV